MKLTKLQCCGIALLINNIRIHGNEWLESGTIKFRTNPYGNFISMFVECSEKNVVYQFTLEKNENIDDSISYRFEYDNSLKSYRVIEEMVVGES